MSVNLVNDSNNLARCEAQVQGADRVAVDTEFHAERRYMPRLYLVQIHVEGGDTWLVDPLQGQHLSALSGALCSTPWVVHGGSQDMRLLLRALGGLPEQILDTQIGAALVQPTFPASYAFLQHTLNAKHLAKRATLSDWSKRPLSQEQLEYAAEDVTELLPLWDRIEERLQVVGRSAIARQACADARSQVLDPPAFDLAWRNIHAIKFLTPQQAAVAQELAAWRIERATTTNQPIRSVLPDGLLADLSRTQPSTIESLGENRRLSRSLVRKSGEELLERIARARQRPEWAWPEVIAPVSARARTVRWLCLLTEALGQLHSFAQPLILPPLVAEDLVLLPQQDRVSIARALGWRDSLIGDEVHGALAGSVSLGLCAGELEARIVLAEAEE